MTGGGRRRVLATHGGRFQIDDVAGYAILLLAAGEDPPCEGRGPDFAERLVRTRDAATLRRADVVWDAGGQWDPARGRFDHHQDGAPVRPCGTPYSSAGLLWAVHGRRVCERALSGWAREADPDLVEAAWSTLDRGLVRAIDRTDNGMGAPECSDLAAVVADMNPLWEEPTASSAAGRELRDRDFRAAASLLCDVIWRRVRTAASARRAVLRAARLHRETGGGPLLELPRRTPWDSPDADPAAVDWGGDGEPPLVSVWPDDSCPGSPVSWMVGCAPGRGDDAPPPGGAPSPPKAPLPRSWRGLCGPALRDRAGIAAAQFCHPYGHLGGASDREGALAMARAAIGGQPSPRGSRDVGDVP